MGLQLELKRVIVQQRLLYLQLMYFGLEQQLKVLELVPLVLLHDDDDGGGGDVITINKLN